MTKEFTRSSIYPCLYYDDAKSAMEWLERAFGFQTRMVVPGPENTIAHSEMTMGEGVVMISTSKPEKGWVSPRRLAAVHQALCIQVEDPDAHYARASAAGAEILQPLKDEDYGSRGYMAKDPEGNVWYFGTYRPGAYWE